VKQGLSNSCIHSAIIAHVAQTTFFNRDANLATTHDLLFAMRQGEGVLEASNKSTQKNPTTKQRPSGFLLACPRTRAAHHANKST
jgi:hypothetical protein